MTEQYDKIIIGAGFYGLYAAFLCCRKGQHVLVLECEKEPFRRATYYNQARVHQGYHYPRSISTAVKSAGYFERFNKDFAFCINKEFDQIYATSKQYSWSDAKQFQDFCRAARIPCEELLPEKYFQKGMCDGAFLTREYTYDAMLLKEYLTDQILAYQANARIQYGVKITRIERLQDAYAVYLKDGTEYRAGFLLNASYASSNQVGYGWV